MGLIYHFTHLHNLGVRIKIINLNEEFIICK